MTIRHLKIFTTVADEKGMSAAAKKLHISQPSVSQAIAELEKYYGVKLFERLSQKIYLTKEGELMLSFLLKKIKKQTIKQYLNQKIMVLF